MHSVEVIAIAAASVAVVIIPAADAPD